MPCHFPSIGNSEAQVLKLAADRPFADPDKAARRLLEQAHAFEPVQEGRIYILRGSTAPFLYVDKGSPGEYSAGLMLAIERGRLEIHDSGTFVKFTGWIRLFRTNIDLLNSSSGCRETER